MDLSDVIKQAIERADRVGQRNPKARLGTAIKMITSAVERRLLLAFFLGFTAGVVGSQSKSLYNLVFTDDRIKNPIDIQRFLDRDEGLDQALHQHGQGVNWYLRDDGIDVRGPALQDSAKLSFRRQFMVFR